MKKATTVELLDLGLTYSTDGAPSRSPWHKWRTKLIQVSELEVEMDDYGPYLHVRVVASGQARSQTYQGRFSILWAEQAAPDALVHSRADAEKPGTGFDADAVIEHFAKRAQISTYHVSQRDRDLLAKMAESGIFQETVIAMIDSKFDNRKPGLSPIERFSYFGNVLDEWNERN